MADDFDKYNEMFGEAARNLDKIRKGSKEVEKSISAWYKASRDIAETQKDIANIENQIEATKKELSTLDELRKKDAAKLTEQEKKTLRVLTEQEKYIKGRLKYLERENKEKREGLNNLKESVKEANKLKSIARSTGSFVKKWGWDKLKSYGIFDMDKAIRNASRSMALGNNQFESFSKNLSTAADSTVMMGVNVTQLAKMQQGYSKEIGRSVRLTQGGLKAMAGLAEGTGLGEQFAIGMASAMDNFGVGAEASADLVEKTMNISGQMGVNGQAAAQALQKNLKLAQRYNFKGGVKALGKMSADAVRLKLDMDGIAGLADKVFRPEGAIEMAAQLSVMGGEFAKLGDPMTLMFKARNDFEGFAKDIGKATSEFVEFNKETGSFEVMGGLARDRMRELSKITGISVDKMQEMAVQQKKLETIGGITPVNFEEKDKEFLSSIAEYSEDKKGFTINLGGQEKLISQLRASDLESIRSKEQTLEERAEASRSFDETIKDLMMSLKQILLPVAQGLKKFVGDPLIKLQKQWRDAGFYDSLKSFAKSAISLAGSIAKFIIENPIKSLIGVLGGWAALKAATWIFNGRMLRLGFNMGGPMGGPMGGMGPGGVVGGGGVGASGLFNTRATGAGSAMSRAGMSRMAMVGKNFRGAAGSAGAIGGGILAAGFAGYNEYQENKAMGLDGAENAGRTATKAISAGLGAWGGAAAGAAIGSVVPVIGTVIGGLIGGAIGAYGGGSLGESIGDAVYGNERENAGGSMGYSRLPMNDGIIEFNPKDKFATISNVGMGGGILAASTSQNQLNTLVDNANSNGIVNHKFDKIDINLNFKGNINESTAKEFLDVPGMSEALTTAINEQIAGSQNQNKPSPQPFSA
tara:strand:+ start:2630 stop:5227 length:2598 start_codon:yes stop_codon:yes gene_type:complete